MSAKSDQKSSSDTYLEHDSTSSCKRNRIRTTSAEKINQRKYESNKYLDEEEKVEKERERKKDHHHINHESKISHVAESKVDKFHRNITNSDYDEEDVLVNGKSSVYKTKESLDEIEEADREFENLMRKPNEG